MSTSDEFHYRLPASFGGQRPGAHRGRSLGTGLSFAAHRKLLDHPDPRRIDLRASLRDPQGHWLVRIQRQRVAVPVHAVVDVSASMHFGAERPKLEVVADFIEALGASAFRSGDALGLLAFDHAERDDLFSPPRLSRGAGLAMAQALRECRIESSDQPGLAHRSLRRHAHEEGHPVAPTVEALGRTLARLSGRDGLVFLVSDFHWPIDTLGGLLESLAPACVVPVIVWDPAEIEPPAAHTLMAVSDAETGVRRTLWMRDPLRRQWRDAVAARRAALHALFAEHGLAPFHVQGRFDAEALTRHFMEQVA